MYYDKSEGTYHVKIKCSLKTLKHANSYNLYVHIKKNGCEIPYK